MEKIIKRIDLSSSSLSSHQNQGEAIDQVGGRAHLSRLLFGALALAVLARVFVLFTYQINWDEFYFLSFVHEYLRGDLSRALQAFHVHVFTWLPLVSENEADQIIAARGVMALLQIGTGICLYRISRRYYSAHASWFVVLAYFSIANVLRLGGNFRADPIATFLLIASLDLLLIRSATYLQSAIVGVLLALSAMITMKSALYLPTLALVFFVVFTQSENKQQAFLRGVVIALVGAVALAGMYLWHKSGVNTSIQSSEISLSHGYEKTINWSRIFPRGSYLVGSLIFDFAFWLFVFFGVRHIYRSLIKKEGIDRAQALIYLAFLLPLGSLVFYRNAYPYFYPFMLASVSLLCGMAWDHLPWQDNFKRANRLATFALVWFLVIIAGAGFYLPSVANLNHQKEMLSVIHKAFPDPVPYFDRCSMVAGFPKQGFFMSTWGVENYRLANQPRIDQAITETQPKFLLANIDQLDFATPTAQLQRKKRYEDYALLEQDEQALRNNYIPHWGKLYVAGKQLILPAGSSSQNFEIRIEGQHTLELEADSKIQIDSKTYSQGDVLYLGIGKHTLQAESVPNEAKLTLRWGDNIYRPEKAPPERFLFNQF